MDIKEKAYAFAVNAMTDQIKLIQQAYISGYMEGKGLFYDENMEYIDLGLESGTLWATRFIGQNEDGTDCIRMPFCDALNYNIPTIEQYIELIKLPYEILNNTLTVFGKNGKRLVLPVIGTEENEFFKDSLNIWLISSIDEHDQVEIGELVEPWYNHKPTIAKRFMGYHFPVMTVKKK